MHHIAITNMTGGRNHGAEALVRSIILGANEAMPSQVRFSLHTRDVTYDQWCFRGMVDKTYLSYPLVRPLRAKGPVSDRLLVRGAALAEKLLLKPKSSRRSLATAQEADMIVATGGDVFTSDYKGLRRHAFALHLGAPVALLGQTIGPFVKSDLDYFKASIRNVSLCTVRETQSLEYLKEVAPELEPTLVADVAFLMPPLAADEARRILVDEHHFPIEGKRLVALSISEGIFSYRKDTNREDAIAEVVAFIDGLNADGWSAVLIPHVQELAAGNNDLPVCREVASRCRKPAENVVIMAPLTAPEYKGVIGLCDALVGARTHATIASMSQGIPTVSIAYSRKAWGIMRDYYGQAVAEDTTLDIAKLDREGLRNAFDKAVANGRTPETAARMRDLARVNFQLLAQRLEQGRKNRG